VENVLDVLLYLFENYLEGELEDDSRHADLKLELEQAGFPQNEVEHAFAWLDSLAPNTSLDDETSAPAKGSIRIYATREKETIPSECQGFLLHLEQVGILDPAGRERVIDRLIALADGEMVDLDQLKWVILMVLFRQSEDKSAYSELEDMMYSYEADLLH
jgi:Smg protein